MKMRLFLAGVAAAACLGAVPALAQSINERQAMLDQRIDAGLRSGALTQTEAIVLRGEFRTLANLESSYRNSGGGLSGAERDDLDRRFDALAARIRTERQDGQGGYHGDWQTINQRQAMLDRRIDDGVRSGTLTQQETILLRGDFRTLAALEDSYRRSGGGLSPDERADLDRRFDALTRRIYAQKHDGQARPGWQTINQRQAGIDARIDQGVRSGALTQNEAWQLRSEFRRLAEIEADYRRSGNGLSGAEFDDLDRRFDALSRRVFVQKNDRQSRGGWLSINQRQAMLEERIEAGVRGGTLTQQEAILLRGEFRTLANLEAVYRNSDGGLSDFEFSDLDRRFDALTARIRLQHQDGQTRW